MGTFFTSLQYNQGERPERGGALKCCIEAAHACAMPHLLFHYGPYYMCNPYSCAACVFLNYHLIAPFIELSPLYKVHVANSSMSQFAVPLCMCSQAIGHTVKLIKLILIVVLEHIVNS